MAILPFLLVSNTTASADDVNTLFQSLANVVDGGLTSNNFAPGTTLPVSLLAQNLVEVLVCLRVPSGAISTGILSAPVPLPGSGTYTVKDIRIDGVITTATGTVAPTISVVSGTISGGAFTTTSTIGAATNLGAFTSGQYLAVTPVASGTITAPSHLALNCTVAQTGSQTYTLNATIRLTRSLQ